MPYTQNEIIAKTYAAGIAGAGGGGFPAHIKLASAADTLIANGAECEPLLYSDQYTIVQQPNKLISGIRAAMSAVGAKEAFIALKQHYYQAISAITPYLERFPQIKLHILQDFYPAGDEHLLVYEVLGKLIPQGGIPPQINVLVNNVTTLTQIGYAMQNESVIQRAVTVTGEVKHPCVLNAPIGTSIKDLIDAAGGARIKDYAIIAGGPMMGRITGCDEPITKTISGIIVLPTDHILVTKYSQSITDVLHKARLSCEGCRMCTDMCPRYLLGHQIQPHLAIRGMSYGLHTHTDYFTAAFLCSQCGVCDMLACPCHLSPRKIYRTIKQELASQGVKNPHPLTIPTPHPDRYGRKVSLKRLAQALNLTAYMQKPVFNTEQVIPAQVRIKLLQHIGMPAQPVVNTGNMVKKGQLIGNVDQNKTGALIHASISGQISGVTDDFIEIQSLY